MKESDIFRADRPSCDSAHKSSWGELAAIGLLLATLLSPQVAQAKTLSGIITYDKVPVTLNDGLNYDNITKKPIRNAVVQLFGANGSKIRETVSNANGRYSFSFPDSVSQVRVRVLAMTNNPKIRVQDNTRNAALYSMQTALFNTSANATARNLNAASGWGGSAYTRMRVAGPFACLDAAYTAARSFSAVRPAATFPLLKVNWSVNNRPEGGNIANGQIGTSFYNGAGEMFILGKADIDTDEYDSHVMVHEWGHFFEDKLSRSDSIGGAHGFGDILDPRVAFGEGWGNALSAMIFHPDFNYKDSGGPAQAITFLVLNMESNFSSDPVPGWFSESSVQSILYDLFDPATNEAFDKVALGLGPIFDIMAGEQKSTSALTTIFSFVDALKRRFPGRAADIDTLVARHRLRPVANRFGGGETNNGGSSTNLPVYRAMTVGGPNLVLTFLGDVDNINRLGANRFIRFNTSIASNVTITATTNTDVGITLYLNGRIIGVSDNFFSGTETITFNAVQNASYMLVVQGFVTGEMTGNTYTANIGIQ